MIKEYEITKQYYLNHADSLEKRVLIRNAIERHFSMSELKTIFETKTIEELYEMYNFIESRLRNKINSLKETIDNSEVKTEFVNTIHCRNCNINVLELITQAKSAKQAILIRNGFRYGTGDTKESYENLGYPTFNIEYLNSNEIELPNEVILIKKKNNGYNTIRYGQYLKLTKK